MQMKGIPFFPSKTPVAQMHFASELPLSLAARICTITYGIVFSLPKSIWVGM